MRASLRAVTAVLCTAIASCAAPVPPTQVRVAAPREATDWGALLFPPKAPAATRETAPPAPAPASSSAPPPVFAPTEYYATDDVIPIVAYSDVPAFCAAALRNADIPISQDTPDPNVPRPLHRPTCQRIPVGAPFVGNADFQAVRAVRVVGADFAYSALLVKIDRGLVPLGVQWDVDDPNDPGCPSLVRSIGVESVGVENGLLVVVEHGITQTYVDVPEGRANDSGARQMLVREVKIAKHLGDAIHTRSFAAWSRPEVGWKRQPHAERQVPWDHLIWREWHEVHVLADGSLRVPRST